MNLIYIFGPSAVGKTTVGKELSNLTGYPLLDQHAILDLGTGIFEKRSRKQFVLNLKLKFVIIKTIIESANELHTLIFTDLLHLQEQVTNEFIKRVVNLIKASGGQTYFIELSASPEIRLQRNYSEPRISSKKSKKDVLESEKILLETDKYHKVNTNYDFPFLIKERYLKLLNEDISALDTAIKIQSYFNFG